MPSSLAPASVRVVFKYDFLVLNKFPDGNIPIVLGIGGGSS